MIFKRTAAWVRSEVKEELEAIEHIVTIHDSSILEAVSYHDGSTNIGPYKKENRNKTSLTLREK